MTDRQCAICYNEIRFPIDCGTCVSKYCTDCIILYMESDSRYGQFNCPVCTTGNLSLHITDHVKNNGGDENTVNFYRNVSTRLEQLA